MSNDKDWILIDMNNLPHPNVVRKWKHPEYGIIKGSLVWDGGKYESEKAWWVFPDGGQEADIWLNEFTHYKLAPQKQPVVSNDNQPKETTEQASDKYANSFKNEPDEINSIMFQAFKAGANWATSQHPLQKEQLVKEQWISVADSRKPKDDQWVRCAAKINGVYDNLLPAYTYSKEYDTYTAYGEAQWDGRVTHWTRLPTPPNV